MATLKAHIIKKSFSWHKSIAWIGGLVLFIYTFSAIMHPLMVWTTTQPVQMFPPQMQVDAKDINKIPFILAQNGIKNALLVKAVPTAQGAMLQVTQDNSKPRRYFSFNTGIEIQNFDEMQAKWLASHYTGISQQKIKSVEVQTDFDNAYPWVNRLLPVYKVHFDAPSNPIAYIHTETNALGSITDDTKTIMQTIFGVLHTFNFLDSYDNARVILVFILIMFVLGMVISGFCMIFLIKKRQINDKKRYIHRLVANIIWLPLFCFGFSGTYHLLQGKFAENTRGVRLHEAFEMPKVNLGQNFILINDLKEANLNNLSLLKMNDDYIYRASLASEKAMHNTHSEQHQPQKKVDIHDHFNGLAKEKGAIYLNLKGEKINLNDKEIALFYANKAGFKTEDIKDSQLITHFGMNYDFRNKRLPVWQLTMTSNNIIFIDPMTGILVDHVSVAEQYESLSFSMLHKWNFLVPLTGREVRDILTVAFLSTVIFTTILGFIMLIRRRKH